MKAKELVRIIHIVSGGDENALVIAGASHDVIWLTPGSDVSEDSVKGRELIAAGAHYDDGVESWALFV